MVQVSIIRSGVDGEAVTDAAEAVIAIDRTVGGVVAVEAVDAELGVWLADLPAGAVEALEAAGFYSWVDGQYVVQAEMP